MLQQSWHSVNITVAPDAAEAVEFAFNELGTLGTEINHMQKNTGNTVLVVGYFDAKPDEDLVRFELREALRIYGMPSMSVHSIESHWVEYTDWLAEWKKHWKPVEIGNFIIAPPWEKVSASGKRVIEIEPNMAFGTGTHETTQLCLQAIEENYKPGQSFMDVGTGTGILAIAAAKLATEDTENIEPFSANNEFRSKEAPSVNSVAKVFACDTDVESIAIARENAALNGVAERIEFYVGSISESPPKFDFVCANLTLEVIIPILPLLISITKETLVLSGILSEQKESIIAELRKSNIANYKLDEAGEWISVVALLHKQAKKPPTLAVGF